MRPSVTTYDLDMLNVESRFELPRIVQALKARGHGTLCFWGPPGTGKTALAEHIARSLDRPLLIKQASDLMSKFVGETEQQMAAMFREAEAERAVLLLDEADSFLQDRRGAQRTYEVTEVNEMLQGMERFAGIFICTTNLFEELDEAALRRFAFKIRFKPLSATQRESIWDWWESTASSRLSPGAPVILVLTRWHYDDLAGRFLKEHPGEWKVVHIPAQADDPNRLRPKLAEPPSLLVTPATARAASSASSAQLRSLSGAGSAGSESSSSGKGPLASMSCGASPA